MSLIEILHDELKKAKEDVTLFKINQSGRHTSSSGRDTVVGIIYNFRKSPLF